MSTQNIIIYIVLFLGLLTFEQPKKQKILIIGDSISIGYTPFVKAQLDGHAEIFHNPGNAQHTGTGIEKIADWIGKEEWDIIQFNWGLWDLCYRHPDSKIQGSRDKVNGNLTFSIEEYSKNLDSIIKIMKASSDAKLIFVTTSYVPENEAGRFRQDAIKYNKAALKIMMKHEILINDIYQTSKEIHSKYGKGSDDVHFTTQGSIQLGKVIASFLKEHL